MAPRASATIGKRATSPGVLARAAAATRAALARTLVLLAALALVGLGVALAAAILDYNPRDPSFGTATGRLATNVAGPAGAHAADLLLQLFGWAALAIAPIIAIAGLRIAQRRPFGVRRAALGTLAALLLGAAALGAVGTEGAGLPAGHGGIFGLLADRAAGTLAAIPVLAEVPMPLLFAMVLAPAAISAWIWASGLGLADMTA